MRSTIDIVAGVWYHVAVKLSNGNMEFWVGGVRADGRYFFSWGNDFRIEFPSFGASSPFVMDELAFYSWYLTDAEIRELARGPLVLCKQCTANKYCNGSSVQMQCPSGTTSPVGSSKCY